MPEINPVPQKEVEPVVQPAELPSAPVPEVPPVTMPTELPAPAKNPIVPTTDNTVILVDHGDAGKIAEYRKTLNSNDSSSVLNFGASAQKAATQLSTQMVDGVKSKDAGPIGDKLVAMVTQMRGLDFSKADGENKKSLWGKLTGKLTPIAEFVQSYEEVNTHIGVIQDGLETDKVMLLKSVKNLDMLYEAIKAGYYEINNWIAAGEEELIDLDTNVIPKMKAAADPNDMLASQEIADKQSFRDSVDRKTYNLKLTRTVMIQMMPKVRIVQNGDKDIVAKIDDQLVNSIPLWRQQLALAVEIWKQKGANDKTKTVDDYQNELLVQNAKDVRSGQAAVIAQRERGTYSIEAIKESTNELILALQESSTLAEAGRQARVSAAAELAVSENSLKEALRAA